MLAARSAPYLLATYTGVALVAVAYAWRPGGLSLAMLIVTGLLALGVTWFFRDPERTPGPGVVSPADGKVLAVAADGNAARLTIFMAPWSVHVNRSPLDATVRQLDYRRGAHRPAFRKDAEENERLDVELSAPGGPVRVRLIAGTVARRIHPYVEPGAQVKKGQRIGLIAFGSRCELELPGARYRILVGLGDWVRAGETTVAREV